LNGGAGFAPFTPVDCCQTIWKETPPVPGDMAPVLPDWFVLLPEPEQAEKKPVKAMHIAKRMSKE
jgi:hypothetical protein